MDLRLKVSGQEYAIEHTLLQPYQNRIKFGARFNTITSTFENGSRPTACIGVLRTTRSNRNISSEEEEHREKALHNLVEWILTTAQRLYERRHNIPWPSPWDLARAAG